MKADEMMPAISHEFGSAPLVRMYMTTGPNVTAYQTYWLGSDSFDDFMDTVKRDNKLRLTDPAWGEIYKHRLMLNHWDDAIPIDTTSDHIRELTTYSDTGLVKIVDLAGTTCIGIDNDIGDGDIRIYITDGNGDGPLFNPYAFTFHSFIQGKFRIYPYDCADPAPSDTANLDGEYDVYVNEGIIVFAKHNDW